MIVLNHGWLWLVVVGVVFVATAAAVGRLVGLFPGRPVVWAAARAVVQLAVVSTIVAAVLASLPLSAAFLLVMVAVATLTSARRAKVGWAGAWLALAIVGGALPALALLLVTGVVPLAGVAVVPMGGILVGGAMTATTLAVRRALDALVQRYGEFEAALALGFPERDAAREIVRRPAVDALLPALDQTRTVGLVTLPGAFVGMLLAGAPAWQAGAVQLIVLLALLAVESVAIAVVTELVAHGFVRRASQVGEVRLT
ncbi:ABC transporter permease [Longimycelium tulufanense]|uniref:ABC transporter permease n=1 Tax=Longimycelium tulufanense TaxID=907463 RepID=UPI001E5FA4E1|nr:ABC transporter permease [Longimycelium tulufanense]